MADMGWRDGSAVAAVLAIVVAGWQIKANRDAANRRAAVEHQQQQRRDRAELKLAAISVVLDAPTCAAAEARAVLAKSVLGDILPADFVDDVRRVRVAVFPVFDIRVFPTVVTPLPANVSYDELRRRWGLEP